MLRIVTGKGGVGKTTVVAALALAEARRGKKVLVLEMSGTDRVAAILGVPPTGPHLREVNERIFLVDMDVQETIREYVLLSLRIEALYKAVFENRFVKRFLRLVPALGHLVMLGKTWYHARENEDGHRLFDLLILDAPATGHACAMLRTPQIVERAVPPGPVRENARRIHAMLVDPERTRVHVVTTPEEMPVNEALEIRQVAQDLGILCGETIVNQHLSPLSSSAVAKLAPLRTDPDLGPLIAAMITRESRRRQGEDYLSRLGPEVLRNAVFLPPVIDAELGRAAIETLANRLNDQPFEEPGA